MKCPKCSYLGFDTGNRCRNCGYDFSLIAAPAEPAPDLTLHDPPAATETVDSPLPLFLQNHGSDEPLITRAGPPRAPLSVRRTPEMPRLRPVSRASRQPDPEPEPVLEFTEEHAEPAAEREFEPEPRRAHRPAAARREAPRDSPLARRVLAAGVDLVIMAAIDLAVVYFTLRMAALTMNDWRALPPVPMLAFLAILKVGYFSAFTSVGGQTIGKMAAGIQVVGEDEHPVDAVRALQRVLAGALSALTFGLAFIPALIGPDRRPLHDRLARTRVVTRPS
jgi:uncharacterized RDD family membrane protein YckC